MRTLTDADLHELKRLFQDNHSCPFTPDRIRALNDIADTALLVKKTSIMAIVKGFLSLTALLVLFGLIYWGKKTIGG